MNYDDFDPRVGFDLRVATVSMNLYQDQIQEHFGKWRLELHRMDTIFDDVYYRNLTTECGRKRLKEFFNYMIRETPNEAA